MFWKTFSLVQGLETFLKWRATSNLTDTTKAGTIMTPSINKKFKFYQVATLMIFWTPATQKNPPC